MHSGTFYVTLILILNLASGLCLGSGRYQDNNAFMAQNFLRIFLSVCERTCT